jgi:hypothetical protein
VRAWQRTDSYNRDVYTSIDRCQQADELVHAESAQSSMLEVPHLGLIDAEYRAGSPHIPSPDFVEDGLCETLLEFGNGVIHRRKMRAAVGISVSISVRME